MGSLAPAMGALAEQTSAVPPAAWKRRKPTRNGPRRAWTASPDAVRRPEDGYYAQLGRPANHALRRGRDEIVASFVFGDEIA